MNISQSKRDHSCLRGVSFKIWAYCFFFVLVSIISPLLGWLGLATPTNLYLVMTNTELNKKWGEYQNIWLCFKGQDFGSRLTGLHPDHFSWRIARGTLPGSGWEERAGRAFTSYKPGTGVRSISGLWVPDPHSTMAFGWLYMSWKGETAPVQVRTGLGGVLGIGRSPGAVHALNWPAVCSASHWFLQVDGRTQILGTEWAFGKG